MADKRARLTPLALEVLGLLHERPMHPYEIQRLMRERRADLRVKIKAGSLYHTVDRLVAGGEIEAVDTEREGRRPERTVYAITDAGWDAFTTRVSEILATPSDERPQYLVGLSSADDLPFEDALNALEMRVLKLESAVAANRTITERLAEIGLPEMYWVDNQYLLSQQQSELEFTWSLVERLKSGDLEWPNESRAYPDIHIVDTEGYTA